MKIFLSDKFYDPRGDDCICTISLEKLLQVQEYEMAIFAMNFLENQ